MHIEYDIILHMADFTPRTPSPSPSPAPSGGDGGGSFLQESIVALFSGLWALFLWILDALYFLLLSVLVVPSMLIMMWLHKPWEDKLKKKFHLGY